MTIISKALDAYASQRLAWGGDDRSSTVGASEIGQCIRKVFWSKFADDPKVAVPRDPEYVDGWGARVRGTMFEQHFWVPAMRARFGDRLRFAGSAQKTIAKDFLSATPDALITDLTPQEKAEIGTKADCVLAECKTADPRSNLTEAKQENVYQTQVQMGLVRACTPWKPTHAILSYTDSSFWNEVKEFVIEFDEEIYDNAQARATVLMTQTNLECFPPEGWIAGGRECNYCPFTKPCGIERRNLPFAEKDEPVDPQFAAEIAERARALQIAVETVEADEAEVRGLQTEIKDRLREKGVRKIPGVINWMSIKGRTGTDNKALKAAAAEAGIDLKQFETQGDPTDRLVIQIGPDRA